MLYSTIRRFSNVKLGGTSIDKFIKGMDAIPFGFKYFQPKILSAKKGDMKALISYRPVYDGAFPGTMHTGTIATIFDQVSGFCGWSMLDGNMLFICLTLFKLFICMHRCRLFRKYC